jgi:ClpX C4-type zinc finger
VNCPICTQALEGGELVMVCNGCHKALGGGLDVGATGEFRVPSPAELIAHASDPSQPGERPHAIHTCSWCGKLELQVKKLLGRGAVAICDECVSLCSDILDAELGDTWR